MEAFNILLPLHHTWLDLVFSGGKPFEFRNKIGTHWGIGSQVFFYETKRNGGAGLVMGRAQIGDMQAIPQNAVGPPRFLLRYWVEHVFERKESLLPLLDELGDYELPHYRKGTILRYLGRPELMRKVMTASEWVFLDYEGENPVYECEEWLKRIGLIDNYGRYSYQVAIRLENIEKFDSPIALSELGIRRAPQGWCYMPQKGGEPA